MTVGACGVVGRRTGARGRSSSQGRGGSQAARSLGPLGGMTRGRRWGGGGAEAEFLEEVEEGVLAAGGVAFVGVADDEFHGPALAGERTVHDGLTELLELGVGQVGEAVGEGLGRCRLRAGHTRTLRCRGGLEQSATSRRSRVDGADCAGLGGPVGGVRSLAARGAPEGPGVPGTAGVLGRLAH